MTDQSSHPIVSRQVSSGPEGRWREPVGTARWLMQLLRGLVDGQRAYGGPFYVELSITTRCNQSCLGCPYHSSVNRSLLYSSAGTDYMPLEQIEKLSEGLRRLGTREIIITGEGEPFLHPRLFEIVSLFKRAGFYVHLFTNGTLLDESGAGRLIDSGLDVLRVSLWAASPEEYEKCYPGAHPDTFQKTVDGLKLVSGLKARRGATLPTIVLTGPINRHNREGIQHKIRLAADVGTDAVTFTPYRHWGNEFAASSLSRSEIDQVCHELAQSRSLLATLGLNHNIPEALLRFRLGEAFWKDLPCYIGWFHSQIAVDGTVMPCGSCPIPLGNLNECSFPEIWNGSEYRRFRQRCLTAKGWALEDQRCDCSYCCFTSRNARIHRYFQWLAPLVRPSV